MKLYQHIFFYSISLCLLAFSPSVKGQQLSFSAPQKITPGNAKIEILGRNSQGILIREITKSDDVISAYYDDLQLRWKKNVPKREKNAEVAQIILDEDSVIFFYTVPVKSNVVLKGFKTNARLESLNAPVICDTVNSSFANGTPELQFAYTPDRQKIFLYYGDASFKDNKLLHGICFDNNLQTLWKVKVKVKAVDLPVLENAMIDSAGNAFYVVGDMTLRNFNNDFPFTSLNVISVRQNATKVDQYVFNEKNQYFSECQSKLDPRRKNIIIAGLYAEEEGDESKGTYYFIFNDEKDSVLSKKFEPYANEFLVQLTGNNPPRKNDGFFDFKATDLIVKRDGGAILITESQSVSTETYNNTAYNGFGFSTGFTVNYYHYDDIAIYSFSPKGEIDWKQILHKKQTSEGDGGYYSSFVKMIGADKLYLIYNDVENGQTSVSDFSISVKGDQVRGDIFSADRKGVMVIPQYSKQVSVFDLIMPSIKKNYLQFVKISF